ncbi:glycerate kinase [Sporolactobacillus shoreicorticis]|uniref:Glycerate kinase n=1 Tax=Sporolactobacillus shoreicorticis TaxID=1923877 RepID=A0ABW5RXZ4_9BACL|nr:glycerate kinase [Sporolactobacillus shoreicorticis]MCO7124979.1 glycerate kinase [Sporolactobacillus shoreicorticis]
MKQKKIVIAPDSFKESLSALEVAQSIQEGLHKVWPDADYVLVPMADGGEGTVRSLVDALNGELIHKQVTGPLGEPTEAFYGLINDNHTAVIEIAAAAGLEHLKKAERNPLIATTYGVGELIHSAMDHGARHIILGLGGSATNDGGCGMAQALGARLLDAEGQELSAGGSALIHLDTIDLSGLDPRLKEVRFEAATDVTNPLTGSKGASAIFGPQKGADPDEVIRLDQALARFAMIVRRDHKSEIETVPGSGAAGGLGAGAFFFLNSTIHPGIELVIKESGLEEKISDATLVITGEGKIDGQTIFGKTLIGVAKCAKRHYVPVIAFAGSLAEGSESVSEHGIDALFSIVPGIVSLDQALKDTRVNLIRTAANIARVWQIAQNK